MGSRKTLFILMFSSLIVSCLFFTSSIFILNYIFGCLFIVTGITYLIDKKKKYEVHLKGNDVITVSSRNLGIINFVWAILIIVVSPFKRFPGPVGFVLSLIFVVLIGIPGLFIEIFFMIKLYGRVWQNIKTHK